MRAACRLVSGQSDCVIDEILSCSRVCASINKPSPSDHRSVLSRNIPTLPAEQSSVSVVFALFQLS